METGKSKKRSVIHDYQQRVRIKFPGSFFVIKNRLLSKKINDAKQS